MDTYVGNTITIHDPTPEIINWCNKHLVLPNPDYDKKLRMGFWVGNTPKTLVLYERRGRSIVLPYGTLRSIMPMLKAGEIEQIFTEPYYVDYGGDPVPLYDYQQEAVEAMFQHRYGILQSPAGSGKTQMGIALIKKYGRTALWITHTLDLLKQSRERALKYIPRGQIGTITEGKVNLSEGVTFATIQTLSKLDLASYRDFWDVIIVDECHHVSGSPTRITQYYNVLSKLAARHKYGLSATVHRADGLIQATYAMLGEVMYTVSDEAVESKIMRVGVKPINTHVLPTEDCYKPDGTLDFTGMINYLTAVPERNHMIVDDIIRNENHSCLILSDRVGHLETLQAMLPLDMRERSVLITGKMTTKAQKAVRESALDKMRSGELQYLFATYALSKEGLDIPRLDRLFMASPVHDEAVVIQSLGRIARTFPGKENPIAYDYIDAIRYCARAYKERTRHYDKIGAYYVP